MKKTDRQIYEQSCFLSSPWSLGTRVRMQLWETCWTVLCRWTPKPMNGWRLFWMRLFGAQIEGHPQIHPRARIKMPWKLHLQDECCIGDRTWLYSCGRIRIGRRAILGPESFVCTGTHDLDSPNRELISCDICIDEYAFIGSRALVLPGVCVGKHARIGAGAVVTKDVPDHCTAVGNPIRLIRRNE
ncbi:MAG: putative colanic acid biosynthesis acetyltransferase [Nanoarchaeota archaeon]